MIRRVLLTTMILLTATDIWAQSSHSKGSVFHTIGDGYRHVVTAPQPDSLEMDDYTTEDNVCNPAPDSIRRYLPMVSLPLKSIKVNSPFGMRRDPLNRRNYRMHNGVDLAAHYENVFSMLPGTVSITGYSKTGGNYITVDHGVCSCSYLHLSKILAIKGQHVNAGQIIAISGNSGSRTTGPHLHLSAKLTKGNKYFNPMLILGFVSDQLQQYQSN